MATPVQPSLNLQRVYLKGLSLEMPNAPAIFLEQGEVGMQMDVQVTQSVLSDDTFEVVVRATLTATLKEKTLYLIEALQAGIFQHSGVPSEHLPAIFNVAGPNMVYPYLRVNIADALTRAALPVFHVPDVNWTALFEQTQAQQLAAAGGAANDLAAPTTVH